MTLPSPKLKASRIARSVTIDVEERHRPSEYTQRNSRASTLGAIHNPLLSLAHPKYGLPTRLISNLAALGVRAIYPWQSACLLGRHILTGEQNLVYTAPTGGGKSLVADILMLNKVIENPGKKAILVLPYVALVQEKIKWLRRVVEGVEQRTDALTSQVPSWKLRPTCIRSAGFFGGSHAKATWADIDITVCTIEKANALVNTTIEEGKIDQLGIVVLDELHMLDEENHGYLIELMITKLLSLQHGIQLVGMSATLSNPQLIADWLDAKFYVSKYRPIPIEEHLVYNNVIYPTANAKEFFRTASQLTCEKATQRPLVAQRTIERSVHHELDNPPLNAVVALAVDTATSGYGAPVFCGSRQGTQTTATFISDSMPSDNVARDTLEQRADVLAGLQTLPGGFESTFAKTIPAGVGFHHAGLTVEERDIVADAFDRVVIRVIVATCSLAAGINLPARRVILHGARMGRDLVGPAMLRQMRGRAGRKGKDEVRETYLVCQKSDLDAVADFLEAELPPVESCLTPEKRGVKRALLEVVVTRLANSRDALDEYIQRSLLWQTMEHDQVRRTVGTAIEDLLKTQLIEVKPYNVLEPTKLGQATVASSLTPDDGIFVHTEMRRALESFVMDGEMHIFYLFTPVHTAAEISWPVFRDELERLDESGIRALRCVGISPNLVNKLVNSGAEMKESTPEEANMVGIYRRAYCAFQLRDLCNEVPIHNISLKFAIPRGSFQNLVSLSFEKFMTGARAAVHLALTLATSLT